VKVHHVDGPAFERLCDRAAHVAMDRRIRGGVDEALVVREG
jgi:hypothetical protein